MHAGDVSHDASDALEWDTEAWDMTPFRSPTDGGPPADADDAEIDLGPLYDPEAPEPEAPDPEAPEPEAPEPEAPEPEAPEPEPEPGDCGPERCNGRDDDCDGRLDESDPALGSACRVGMGACARDGERACTGGELHCTARPAPAAAERCNGIDDDCDGNTDEGFADLGRPCTIGSGDCRSEGRFACSADGTRAICDAPAIPPRPELCNDADDDCDGRTDEGFDVGRACDEGIGLCLRSGRMRCDGVRAYCDAEPGRPRAEICDGADGDCDGRADEGLPGSLIIRNEWVQEAQFSAGCGLVLTEFPVMYASVDCRLDDRNCERVAIEGPGAALYEGPPGRHTVHVRCCLIDGTRCFGQDRSCSFPNSAEVFPCTCLEGSFDVNVAQCREAEFVACSR